MWHSCVVIDRRRIQGSSSSHIGHGEEVQVFYTDDQEEWIADLDFRTVAWKKASTVDPRVSASEVQRMKSIANRH